MADLHPTPKVVATKAAAACDRAGVQYAIIGGIAVNAYGMTRQTKDADFVVALGKDEGAQVDRLLAELVVEGFRVNPTAVRRRFDRGPYLMTTFLGLTRIDFLLKRPDAYWQSALENRRRIAYEGSDLWFASPEDVIALKLVANRPQDVIDVQRVMAVYRDKLDRPRLRGLAERFAVTAKRPDLPADLEKFLAEADALPDGASEL